MSTGKLRFLTLVKPVLHVLPEVAQPDRKIPFKVRESSYLSRVVCSISETPAVRRCHSAAGLAVRLQG